MIQQIQYNTHNISSAANYSSTSTSRSDSFIEILKNSTIIIECEVSRKNTVNKVADEARGLK